MTDRNPFRWPEAFDLLWVERVWGSFGWLSHLFPQWVYRLIVIVLVVVAVTGVVAMVRRREAVIARLPETLLLLATAPIVLTAVHFGLVSLTPRTALPEQGRYLFPAITALAALAIGACTVAGRRHVLALAATLVTLMMGLGFAGQLLWLTGTYA
jgi:hypothetical protein